MVQLNAFVSKQVQLQELVACIRHFDICRLRLHLFGSHGQIVPGEARQILREICPSVQLDVMTFDIKDHRTVRALVALQADMIAFPLYHSSAFYLAISRLRKKSTIIHLTDGLGDQFTMWELQRAVLAKSTLRLLKGIAVTSFLRLCRADIEFSNFHPQISPYAKSSRPVGAFPMTERKVSYLSGLFGREKPDALIIEGFDLGAERIAAEAGIGSYVATRRSGGLNVSGKIHLSNQVVCAEEVLELMRPRMVIGCPSTSLVAARIAHEGTPVMCITSPEAAKVRGKHFNPIFRQHAKRYGVSFAESDDVEIQFSEMRGWLSAISKLAA